MTDLSEYEQQIVDHVKCLLDDIKLTVTELEAETKSIRILTMREVASNHKDQANRKDIATARQVAIRASLEEREIASKVADALRAINQNSSFSVYKPSRSTGRLTLLEQLTRLVGDDVFLELKDLHNNALTHLEAIKSYQCQLATAIKWFPYRNGPFRAATGRYRNTETDIQSAKDALLTFDPNRPPRRR